jgi:4-alpha-glucanotransferase
MVTLLLAIHHHQPVGNLDEVFAAAFARCYAPVLAILGRHPAVRVALHHSGPLVDWLEVHEPAYLRDVETLAARGQIEIVGGGYYEPILAALPARDARGQLGLMGDYWQARTGRRPEGFWLTERIWDPALPATLASTGLRYTFVDDSQFRAAGLTASPLSGYYVTERAGAPLALFPIDQRLRYLIPFAATPDEVVAYLAAQPADTTLTYGDDGEKFGVWPHTHEWVIEKGWLDRFFGLLEDGAERVRTSTPAEYLAAHRPSGRVYLPSGSYEEMMEWSLPVDVSASFRALRDEIERRGERERYAPYVRGGVWENFLVKYPESNQLHKRMLLVSERLAAAARAGLSAAELAPARRALFEGQCNCAYWHGLFGGLYVNYLRHAVYGALIRSDRLLDRLTGAAVDLRALDYDCDGDAELVATTPELVAIVTPARGGALVELDWKPAAFNVLDTLSRKREAYSERLRACDSSGDQRRAPELVVDQHPRHSFLDHLWPPDATLERVERAEPLDVVALAAERYAVGAVTCAAGTWSAVLEWRGDAGGVALVLVKRYASAPAGDGVTVTYTLRCAHAATLWFAVECNLALLAGSAPDRYFEFEDAEGAAIEGARVGARNLASRGTLEQLRAVTLVDEYSRLRVRLAASVPFGCWRFPVETVNAAEGDVQQSYQASALYCHWRLSLVPGAEFTTTLALTVGGW